jgi:hypothetical protein
MLRRRILEMTCLTAAVLVAGCAPSIYKQEVLDFKTSSEQAIDAFDGLRTDTKTLELLEASVGKQEIDTTGPCGDIVEKRLQRDAGCFEAWARFRATAGGQLGPPPTCVEPTGFYVLPLGQERDACRLGVGTRNAPQGSSVDPSQFPSSALLSETAALGAKLREYAAALNELAISKDGDALQSAVGKARATMESLVDRLQRTAKSDLSRGTMGPISDLIGASLVWALEYWRYEAMKRVVEEADPIVTQAAQVLSRASVVLLIPRLRAASNVVNDTITEARHASEKEFVARLHKARVAVDDYLGLYAADPGASFEAMATAHQKLNEALGDAKRGLVALKSATADFAEKAEAAYKVFGRPKEKANGYERGTEPSSGCRALRPCEAHRG